MAFFAVFSLFLALVAAAYGLLSGLVAAGQHRLARTRSPAAPARAAGPALSIVVPTRDDGAALGPLLRSLQGQVAKGDEILIIDDHSTAMNYGQLKSLLREFSLPTKLIRHTGLPGKKEALAYGIAQARHELLFQTDADCYLEKGGLDALRQSFSRPGVLMVMGLVTMQAGQSAAGKFAAVEFQSLQMAGMAFAALGRPIMGSAAAMAYRRGVYERFGQVGKEQASGDDVFLIQALQAQAPGSIRPVPQLRVATPAPHSWKDFLEQRVRWGGKTPAYPSFRARLVALLVALYPLLTLLLLASGLIWPPGLAYGLLLGAVKYLLDTFNLLLWYRRYQPQIPWSAILQAGLIYPFYIAVVLLLLPFYKPQWRGRKMGSRARN